MSRILLESVQEAIASEEEVSKFAQVLKRKVSEVSKMAKKYVAVEDVKELRIVDGF